MTFRELRLNNSEVNYAKNDAFETLLFSCIAVVYSNHNSCAYLSKHNKLFRSSCYPF